MSALRRPAPYRAERTEAGGWRITLPVLPPTQNEVDREHWRARKRRIDALTSDLLWMRTFKRLREPVFERAALSVTIHFATARKRDPLNYWGGMKQHVDALRHAGWLAEDDAAHLRLAAEPVLMVDRANARVEVTLEPWDGKR